jgi:hypothetical protein
MGPVVVVLEAADDDAGRYADSFRETPYVVDGLEGGQFPGVTTRDEDVAGESVGLGLARVIRG